MILPRALRDHALGRLVAQFERGRQVHCDRRVPLRSAEVEYFRERADAGAVDENVETVRAARTQCVDHAGRTARRGDVDLRGIRNVARRPRTIGPVLPSSSVTLGTNTSAPALASASVKAWPSPVLPPVTMAFLPASEKKSIEKSPISIANRPVSR